MPRLLPDAGHRRLLGGASGVRVRKGDGALFEEGEVAGVALTAEDIHQVEQSEPPPSILAVVERRIGIQPRDTLVVGQ